ncbi:hypothetical protein Tco_0011458 [Tanacetum coccineum]
MEQPRVPQARARMRPSKEWPMMAYDSRWTLMCTDISKITRKPSKTGKHGHEKGRVNKSRKPKPEKVKSSVNSSQSWST